MRLIDADEIGLTDFEIVMCNGDYKEALKMLLDKISNQPTAYSVDKVVKELEELKMRYFLTIANTGDEKSDFAYENVGNVLDKAIEIVQEVVEEYKGGWIACSEKLPDLSRMFL